MEINYLRCWVLFVFVIFIIFTILMFAIPMSGAARWVTWSIVTAIILTAYLGYLFLGPFCLDAKMVRWIRTDAERDGKKSPILEKPCS